MSARLKGRRFLYLLAVLSVVLVAFIVLFASRRAGEDVSAALPLPAPILTTLNAPSNGSAYPLDAHIPVSGKAVSGEPLVALELWVDGTLTERKEATPDAQSDLMYAFWSWRPGTEGVHTLLLRAVDATGAVAESRAVRVRAVAAVGARVSHEMQEESTVAAAAERLGVSVDDLLLANPDLNADDVLAPGQPLFISVGGTSPVPPGAAAITGVEGDTTKPGTQKPPPPALKRPAAAGAPEAPGLAGSADGCAVSLQVADHSDNEHEFRIYHLGPDDTYFSPALTLPGNDGGQIAAQSIPGSPGHNEFYATASNDAGESASDIVAVDVDPAVCLALGIGRAGIARDTRLRPDGLLLAAREVERVYYYVSLADGAWQRVPAAPDEFIAPRAASELALSSGDSVDREWQEAIDGVRHAFDLAGPIAQGIADAPLGDSDVEVEVWGWAGDGLVRVTRFKRPVGVEGSSLADIWRAGATDLSICSHPGDCREGLGWVSGELAVDWSDPDREREFLWSTQAIGVTGAVWQLSQVDFGPAFDPAPPGLVAAIPLIGKGGEFSYDFAAPDAEPHGAQASGSQAATEGAGKTSLPVVSPSGGGGNPLSLVIGQSGATGLTVHEGLSLPRTYYARVVPMAGTNQAGDPSKTIVIRYGPVGDQENPLIPAPPGIYELEVSDVRPVVFPNSDLWGCVSITRNDRYTGSANPWSSDLWETVAVGATVCPQVYRGEGEAAWYEQMFDFIAGAVDWAANFYEEAKNMAIAAVASTIPFCGENCKAALKMGLNVALVAVGMPPSLPSFDALTEMGEAYVVSFLAEQIGPECSEGSLCYDAIEKSVDNLKEVAAAGGSNAACAGEEEAHANGREPLCLPPGVVGVPVKGAQPEPATVELRLSRPSNSPAVSESDLKSYRLRIFSHVTNDGYAGQTVMVAVNTNMLYGSYLHSQTEQRPLYIDGALIAPLFAPVELPAPRLKPGESVVVPIPLEAVGYWFPGHREMIQAAGGYVKYDDWFKLYFQGQLSVSAAVDCFTTIGWTNCGYPNRGTDTHEVTLPADYF